MGPPATQEQGLGGLELGVSSVSGRVGLSGLCGVLGFFGFRNEVSGFDELSDDAWARRVGWMARGCAAPIPVEVMQVGTHACLLASIQTSSQPAKPAIHARMPA